MGVSLGNLDDAFADAVLFDDLCDEKDLEIKYGDILAEVHLNIIDTPGLNGTDKNDEDNMFELLKCLREVGSVNSILFFNKGTNYGKNFKEI